MGVESDERILGSGDFVNQLLDETDGRLKRQLPINERRERAVRHVVAVCKREDINIEEIKGGVRRGKLSQLRAQLAIELVEGFGISLAEAGRQLGVSTSAISKALTRAAKKNST
jgi:hypothetical protein